MSETLLWESQSRGSKETLSDHLSVGGCGCEGVVVPAQVV